MTPTHPAAMPINTLRYVTFDDVIMFTLTLLLLFASLRRLGCMDSEGLGGLHHRTRRLKWLTDGLRGRRVRRPYRLRGLNVISVNVVFCLSLLAKSFVNGADIK